VQPRDAGQEPSVPHTALADTQTESRFEEAKTGRIAQPSLSGVDNMEGDSETATKVIKKLAERRDAVPPRWTRLCTTKLKTPSVA
jgi:hypothetical protein